MPRYVALLRGVNLGATNKVAMPALRQLFESLGYTDVSTFIQSGNVVFSSRSAAEARALEDAINDEFKLSIRVAVRTGADLKKVLAGNPFPQADTSKLHVGFYVKKPPAAAVKALDVLQAGPEEFAVVGTHVYLHLPNGMGRTKLPGSLDRKLKVPCTIRTWKTVTKLAELAK